MTQQTEPAAKSPPMTRPLEGVPLPDLERVPDYERGFWEGTRNGELRIQRCSDCGRYRHLPTPMCPECSSLDYTWTVVSGRGFVYSYVIVRHPVHPGDPRKGTDPLQRLHDRIGRTGGPADLQQRPPRRPGGHQHRHAGAGDLHPRRRRTRGGAAGVPARHLGSVVKLCRHSYENSPRPLWERVG